MPMSKEICEKLKLPQMVTDNTDNHETAFTVSIDYAGTTTGISAEERGMTARHCISEDAKPEDFRRPGHMFPLLAKKNGVLERDGHTEATVDLMRLAGLKECGYAVRSCCEDGTMSVQQNSWNWQKNGISVLSRLPPSLNTAKNMTGLWSVQQWQNSRQNMENLKRMAIRIF